jgi:hypothetical protein
MGWQIVSHSFVLLFRNLADALKISIGPYLIGLVAAYGIARATGFPFGALTGTQDFITTVRISPDQAGGVILGGLLIAVLMLFVSAWVAVSWHRFVLLEEYPGMLPGLSGKPVGGYLGRVILLVLILILISLPVGFAFGLLMSPFLAAGPGTGAFVAGFIFGILIGAIMSWFWLRMGLILPSCAVGKSMRIGESWGETARASGAIFQAVLILMVINGVAAYVVGAVFGAGPVGQVLNLIVTWVSIMVGVSILTTLYGHLVENRSID